MSSFSPRDGELTVVIGGPSRGESLVVFFPDGRCMVVDVWERGGFNFPVAVCDYLGVQQVDLAVITHPDHDHVRGFDTLADEIDINRVWRYPSGTVRDVLAAACRAMPDNARLSALADTLELLDGMAAENRSVEADIETAIWPRGSSDYHVHCIAPCPADKTPFYQRLTDLIEHTPTGTQLSESGRKFFENESRNLDLRANALSLGLVIEWGDTRVLLAGDIEAPPGEYRGWNGILRYLEEDGRLDLLKSLKGVKVAHHGSGPGNGRHGAYSQEAWELHSAEGPVEFGLITPYRMAGESPPQNTTLDSLLEVVQNLGASASPDADDWSRFNDVGWKEEHVEPLPRLDDHDAGGHWLAVAIEVDGDVRLYAGDDARFFVETRQ